MNSSVTWDSAISVMSSLCLEIRPSSRSNGPSNTSRCTSNPAGAGARRGLAAMARAVTAPVIAYPPPHARVPQPPGQQARLARRVQVGEQHGQGLPDQPATVHGNAVRAQGQPGALQIEQLGRRQVHGDLLGVGLPAAGLAPAFRRRALGRPAGAARRLPAGLPGADVTRAPGLPPPLQYLPGQLPVGVRPRWTTGRSW